MKRELFIKALNTMLYSWGSDTPSEAIWAFNEFMDFYEAQTGEVIGRIHSEDPDEYHEELEMIMNQIKNGL
jgi:hypothetical protein